MLREREKDGRRESERERERGKDGEIRERDFYANISVEIK